MVLGQIGVWKLNFCGSGQMLKVGKGEITVNFPINADALLKNAGFIGDLPIYTFLRI